jgi:ribosome-binding protein aMBF1 (putative translation factor)
MIKNEKQYKITKSWIKRFETGLDNLKQMPKSKEQPWAKGAQRRSVEGQLALLKTELADYEALKSGKTKVPDLGVVEHLPQWFISKRIAKGWTQGDLAARLKMHYQQIQRYESTDYASATLETLQKVAAALMA